MTILAPAENAKNICTMKGSNVYGDATNTTSSDVIWKMSLLSNVRAK